MKPTLDTYIISDTHFGHANIIKYCNRPEDHDFVMMRNWFRNVAIDDEVLHLGDVLWYKQEEAVKIVKMLPGRKYLIPGNHDKKRKDYWLQELGFTIVPKRIFFDYGPHRILFTHYPDNNFSSNWDINIHGHIHNKGYIRKKDLGRLFLNISVEVMDYTPIKLGDILRKEV